MNTMNNWFYNFLIAHNKLYKLQCGYNESAPLMRDYISKMTHDDKVFFTIINRHLKNCVTNSDLRIFKLYQKELLGITLPVVVNFVKLVEADKFIDKNYAVYNKKIKNTDYHFASYIIHSYEMIKRAYGESQHDILNSHISAVVAFDAVTNTMHHSIDVCRHIVKQSPITGNVDKDAMIINRIVKNDIMNNNIAMALNSYMEYCLVE